MPQSAQERQLVERHFSDRLETYVTEQAQAHRSPVIPFLIKWAHDHHGAVAGSTATLPLQICEFGGGGGVLLSEIQRQIGCEVALHNVELLEAYGPRQVDGAIRFVRGSVLTPPFRSQSFDVVIARNVLHHLLGGTLPDTRANQRHAIAQLLEVTRPGGLVLVEEQVIQDRAACWCVYRLSRLASRLGIRSEAFQITPNAVVAFLTQQQIFSLFRAQGAESLVEEYRRFRPSWRWRLTWLLRNTGEVFLAMRKPE